MIRSGFSDVITWMLGVARSPTEVYLPVFSRIGAMIRSGWSSSATPTGDIPTAAIASTNEYSSATTFVGLPVMVVVPRSCLIVRVDLPHWSSLTSELTPAAAAARLAFGAAPVAGEEEEPPQP